MPTCRPIATLLAIAAAYALPATAQAAGFKQFANASMSGVHRADAGFERNVGHPKAMRLQIAVEPDQPLNLQYRVQCGRRYPEAWGVRAARNISRSSGWFRLPIPISRPRTCIVFAYVKYRNPDIDDEVNLRLTLLVKQR